jgi:group I intron endonuclease
MVLILKINVLIPIVVLPFLFVNLELIGKYSYIYFTYSNIKKDYNLSNEGYKLINLILEKNSWPFIEKRKKHIFIEHCKNFIKDHNLYQKKWLNISGIYKITFLPLKLFSYYGSSKNIGQRIKYHYYNGSKQNNFLGLFIKEFGWSCFSVTLIEKCSPDTLQVKEDWYLTKFKPLLNFMTKSYSDPRRGNQVSVMTKYKISKALIGRKHSLSSKIKMTKSRTGIKNSYYGKRLPPFTLEAARLIKGKKIYVYYADNLSLVNNSPFLSIRETVNCLPISAVTLKSKLDKGIPFKGYYYFSSPNKK